MHNDLGFFNSAADARAAASDRQFYDLFAYRLLPIRFSGGQQEPATLPPLAIEPITTTFESLGFDVVSKGDFDSFECSPLSCNGMANEVPVNRHCLIDTLPEAIALAERFSSEEPEPGPYFVLEVLRLHEKRTALAVHLLD